MPSVDRRGGHSAAPSTGGASSCIATLQRQTGRVQCIANKTFGCFDAKTVWLRGCEGKFECGSAAAQAVKSSKKSKALCNTATEWQLEATEWWRSYRPVARARESTPPALVFGAMLNLVSSPYTTNGAVRGGDDGHGDANARRYHYTRGKVLSAVDRFVSAAATRRLLADGQLRVHLVHDLPQGAVGSSHAGVQLHRVTGGPIASASGKPIPAQDARWDAYLRVLREIESEAAAAPGGGGDACAFSVDFSDVRILNDLRVLCERTPAAALFTSSDLCHANQV